MQQTAMNLFKKGLSLFLALLMVLSMVYFAPAEHVHAASASDYISTTYPANLSVKTKEVTNLHIYPTSGSTAKHTLPVGTMLSVKALYKTTENQYWYKVLYYNTTLYVNATATTMVSHLTGDITATDLMTPAAIGYGSGFPLKGTITSSLNKLGILTADVLYSSNITGATAITSSVTVNGYSYTIDSSTLDNNMIFSDLAAGSYTFILKVQAISNYINDSGTLATSTIYVVLDNKPLVVTNVNKANPVVAKGIDVSTWQGTINWSSASQEIDFAILRLGYSTSLDDQFKNNASGCNTYGVPFGVYLYSYATTTAEAKAEAEFAISALSNYDVDLPVFFDFEDEDQINLSSATKNAIVKTFCDTLNDAGYQAGLYTFLSWFNSYFTDSYYSSMPKWVAQISSSCSYAKGLTMWQYSWTGSVSGISGDVDMNYYYGEFPGKNTDTSYLSKCTYYPSYLNVKSTSALNLKQYPASSYSTVKTISANTYVNAVGLYKNAAGEYWYEINNGGTVGYVPASSISSTQLRFNDISIRNQAMATNLNVGAGYYLTGVLRSQSNRLGVVRAKVYKGEDTSASPVLSSSDSPYVKTYNLYHSNVCDNMIFSDLSAGYYTFEISVDSKNYYISSGALKSTTQNTVVWTAPFTVGGASITPPTSVCSHNAVTDPAVAATCTTTGLTEGSHCSICKAVIKAQTTTPALGHNYVDTTIPATCQDYEKVQHKCSRCGDSSDTYSNVTYTSWSTTKPTGVDSKFIESKTQYRYSDYETKTSYETSLSGYTLKSSAWVQSGTGTINYVKSWPSGFSTSSSLYTTYNKTKKTASETATTKTTINSDSKVGYLWYHWCGGGAYSAESKTSSYTTFHAFYSTAYTPGTNTDSYDSSDGSYKISDSTACSTCVWYWPIEVYAQKYTNYKKQFTYERWTDYTEWSDTAVTASSTRKVETRTVYRVITGELGDHKWVNGVCSICQDACSHSWTDGACSICGSTCDHTWSNGNCSSCGTVCTHNWANGTCATCGTVCSHAWANGVCSTCGTICSHTWNNGTCSTCAISCAHNWNNGTCSTCQLVCTHNWSNGTCTVCGLGCVHNWSNGVCSNCNLVCGHAWNNGTCDTCGKVCSHSWSSGTCISCGTACDHSWTDGVCNTCGMTCSHNWIDGECEICKKVCSHTYENGYCTDCGMKSPTQDYYLFGFINGAEYACEGDYKNTGEYMFVDGKLTATFDSDSYIGVKTGDNQNWYMTLAWLGYETTAATLYSTSDGAYEKLFVPGGVKIEFTLVVNDNNTLDLSYVIKSNPTLTPLGPTLALEGQIQYNIHYTITDMGNVALEDMGLIGWSSSQKDGTFATAEFVSPGATRSGNRYMVHSEGIPAKELGDSLYFKIYAKMPNGTYIYSSMFRFSAKLYAEAVLASSTDTKLNQVCVSLLNYGTAAQEYFGYKADEPINGSLTDAQKALVSDYTSSMVSPMEKVDSSKVGSFTATAGGFTSKMPSVSLEGAFAINYYFQPAKAVEGEMLFYYWDPKTYDSLDVLTTENALGVKTMSIDETGKYWASYDGIAAKEINDTVYVAAIYQSGGVSYCTGVLACNVSAISLMQMSSGSAALQALTQDMLVYGYYAKEYFGN